MMIESFNTFITNEAMHCISILFYLAIQTINKGEISLRNEILSGNYSTKTDDKNNIEYNNCNNNLHVNIYTLFYIIYKYFSHIE